MQIPANQSLADTRSYISLLRDLEEGTSCQELATGSLWVGRYGESPQKRTGYPF